MEAEAKTIPLNAQPEQSKHLTKEQRERRRAIERLNKEVSDMLARLVNQWYQVFLDNDPTSAVVSEKQRDVSAKWKMYCQRHRLKAEVFGLADKSIEQLTNEYQQARAAEKTEAKKDPPTQLQRFIALFRKRQKTKQ